MKHHAHRPAVYILVRQNDQMLLIMREQTGFCDGYYALPSGKVDPGEGFIEAAQREAREEVGIDIAAEDLRFVHFSQRRSEQVWDDVYFVADKWQGTPRNCEPQKHSHVRWFPIDDLPGKLIPYIASVLEHIERGELYSEVGISSCENTPSMKLAALH